MLFLFVFASKRSAGGQLEHPCDVKSSITATGSKFPAKYKNGAFIAFHGSWNRAPLPQKGFFVVFVPFKDGKPSGDWEIFADNFAERETVNSTREAKYRPCGLAQGPDGALYVTDDTKGIIWKIVYNK